MAPCSACVERNCAESCELSFPDSSMSFKLTQQGKANINPASKLPYSTFEIAVGNVIRTFPELFFLHRKSVLAMFNKKVKTRDEILFINCIAALCGVSCPVEGSILSQESREVKEEMFAKFVNSRILDLNHFETQIENSLKIRCMVMLACYKSVMGADKDADMLIEFSLSLLKFTRLPSIKVKDDQVEMDYDREVLVRLFWSCFFIKRTISMEEPYISGSSQLELLPLPTSHQNFNRLAADPGAKIALMAMSLKDFDILPGANLQAYFIKICEIYGRLTAWHFKGGRWIEKNPPWHPESSCQKYRKELETYKDKFEDCFNDVTLSVDGELLATRIIIFRRLCVSVLEKAYIPFLGYNISRYEGPIEPPFLPPPPDPDFWDNSIEIIINSEAELLNVINFNNFKLFQSRYMLFAIFSSLVTLLYLINFPCMSRNFDVEMGHRLSERAFMYLQNGVPAISRTYYKIASKIKSLYEMVVKNKSSALSMNLGRESFKTLEDAIVLPMRQHTEPDIDQEIDGGKRLLDAYNFPIFQDLDTILNFFESEQFDSLYNQTPPTDPSPARLNNCCMRKS